MKYRKKPVEIEAIPFSGNNGSYLKKWSNGAVIESPITEPTDDNPTGEYVQIKTLEGVMTGIVGDFIIKGVKGEFYPCKPDIFEATYSASEPTAIDLIAAEREKQISKGYTPEHDASYVERYKDNYAHIANLLLIDGHTPNGWDEIYWESLCDLPYKDQLRISGAWIAAELDRIIYLENKEVNNETN